MENLDIEFTRAIFLGWNEPFCLCNKKKQLVDIV